MANEFILSEDDTIDAPILIGLMGAPSSGKTWSAYELATGMQRATGGDIGVIDTEAKRAKHYIARFREKAKSHGRILHMNFEAPFSADRYVDAIEACAKQGCKTIIVDSASHSHDGPGGMLDHHAEEVERLSRGNADKRDQVQALAWTKPKQAIRRMVTDITTSLKVNAIFCFRAQQKRDWNKKDERKQPTLRGWIPIADISLVYELTVNFLLNPGADGMPDWDPEGSDAGRILKRPEQFRHLLVPGRRIDSDMGEAMAAWALGKDINAKAGARKSESPSGFKTPLLNLLERVQKADSFDALKSIGTEIAAAKKAGALTDGELSNLRQVYAKREHALETEGAPIT